MPETKPARLDFATDEHEQVRRAAEILGQSMRTFIRRAAVRAAQKVIEKKASAGIICEKKS